MVDEDAPRPGYDAEWRSFAAWCARHKIPSLPSPPAALARYVAHIGPLVHARELDLAVAAVTAEHRRAGVPSPDASADVLAAIKRVSESKGQAPKPSRESELAKIVAREEAARIVAAAETLLAPEEEYVVVSADDRFVETLDACELGARLAGLGCARTDALSERVGLHVAILGAGWALVAVFASASDVPEAPAAHELLVADRQPRGVLAGEFPSLVGAPGDHPESLAAWALAVGDAQTRGAAALLIELVAGLEHAEGGRVAELFDGLPGGLAYHLAHVFDAEHREGVERVLRAAGRAVPAPVHSIAA